VESCAGETVTLSCLSDRRMPVDWRHRDFSTSDSRYVVASGFVQKHYEDRFSLNRTAKRQYDLVISNVRLDDQGLYVCIEDAGLGPRHEYQLTVQGQSNIILNSY